MWRRHRICYYYVRRWYVWLIITFTVFLTTKLVVDERHSLLGGYASTSDISTNLCEIEDSECETEQKPLNYLSVHQTEVWHMIIKDLYPKTRFAGWMHVVVRMLKVRLINARGCCDINLVDKFPKPHNK